MTTTTEFEPILLEEYKTIKSTSGRSSKGYYSDCFVSQKSPYVFLEIKKNNFKKLHFYENCLCNIIDIKMIFDDIEHELFVYRVEKLEIPNMMSAYLNAAGIPNYKEIIHVFREIRNYSRISFNNLIENLQNDPEKSLGKLIEVFCYLRDRIESGELVAEELDCHSANYGFASDGQMILFDPVMN